MGSPVAPQARAARRRRLLVRTALGLALAGCAANAGGAPRGTGPRYVEGADPDSVGFEACGDGVDNDLNGAVDCADPVCAGDLSCPTPVADSCVTATLTSGVAPAPVDIVWVVDTSDSMQNERDEVGRRLGDFSASIVAAGLDPHVVLITLPGSISVPPEFSSDREHFLLVPSGVGSSKPLERLLSNLHGAFTPVPHSGYADFLRPEAPTHFVAVTDDDSELGATSFDSQMRGELSRLRGSGDGGYVFHAVASEDTGGHDPCSGAAEVGDEYLRLTASTGGEFQSICSGEWTALFARLTAHITETTPVPCSVPIPAAPDGTTLDYGAVNLWYTPSSTGASVLVPGARSRDACAAAGGWYYDNDAAPTTLELCPATCATVQSDPAGRLDLALGCATVLI